MQLRHLARPAPFIWRLIRFGIYKSPSRLRNYIIGIFKSELKRQRCNICKSQEVKFVYATWAYRFFRCSKCNIYFVENPPETEKIRQEYLVDNQEDYQRERSKYFMLDENNRISWKDWKGWKEQTFIKLNLTDFENKLGVPRRTLEIGCAEGKVLEILKSRGWTVVGLEMGKYMAKLCRESGLPVILGKAEEIVFKAGSFDLVVIFHTLEHTINPLSVMRNIFNVLKRNGRLILEVPYFANKKDLLEDFANIAHLYFFTEKAIDRISDILGFSYLDKFIYEDKLHPPRKNICYLFEKGDNKLP